jgi:hypothetical protein
MANDGEVIQSPSASNLECSVEGVCGSTARVSDNRAGTGYLLSGVKLELARRAPGNELPGIDEKRSIDTTA